MDAGGLTREFLTLLYDHSPVFENSVLGFEEHNYWKKALLINGTNGHNVNFKWPIRTKESHETCCGLHCKWKNHSHNRYTCRSTWPIGAIQEVKYIFKWYFQAKIKSFQATVVVLCYQTE